MPTFSAYLNTRTPIMPKTILPAAQWPLLLQQVKSIAPEMFDSANGRIYNHIAGEWKNFGNGKPYFSPVDGTELGYLPMLTSAEGKAAVTSAAGISWKR